MSDDLIERLEKATGEDREVDLAIHLALYPEGEIAGLMQYRRGLDGREGMAWDIHHGGAVCFEKHTADGRCTYNGGYPLPRYTTSIDAALTLVPEGMSWRICTMTGSILAIVCAANASLSMKTAPTARHGATPAIALCIAALKARMALAAAA